MKKLTNIRLHGELGREMGKEIWNLDVSSVGEAVRAIEILSKRKLYKYLLEKDKDGLQYKILINEREIDTSKIDKEKIETIEASELNLKFGELKTIDIIPVIQGAGKGGSIASIVVGVVLVVVGAILTAYGGGGIGVPMIIAGLGLIAGGVINLLTQPPKFDDFREIGGGKRGSFLFNGPENTTREGGPVPVGYGRLIVGSQVISASYEISHISADDNPLTT